MLEMYKLSTNVNCDKSQAKTDQNTSYTCQKQMDPHLHN